MHAAISKDTQYIRCQSSKITFYFKFFVGAIMKNSDIYLSEFLTLSLDDWLESSHY